MSSLLEYLPTDTLVLGTAIFAVIAVAYWFLTRPKPVPPPIILDRRDRREKESADDPNKPTAKILFASQTGTAELFAKTLGKNGKRFGFNTRVVDLLDYDKDQLDQEKIVIFVVSTYGEGEPPDGAKDFYDWFLELKDGDLDLSGITFMVFGLGDSQYKLFNHIGKRTEKQMKTLGAKLVYTRGIGDADKTLEEDFENWQAEAWPALAAHLGVTYEETEEVIPNFEPQTNLEVFPEESGITYRFPSPGGREPAARFPVYAPVLRNEELLRVTDRSTKHMELDISAFPRLSYEAGDHLAIYAANPRELVDQYLSVLDLQGHSADTVFLLKSKKGPVTVPKCSLREALTWHYDLAGHPKKELLKTLSQYAADPAEKERFQGLFKKQEEYKKLAEKLRTVFGWLRKFNSTRVPLHTFLEVMPLQQVRYYSIASDYMLQPKQIDVCYAVVDGGVCTNFLKGLRPGDHVPIYVRRSTFHIPRQPAASCILVGPGTGVAPFIGFLQRRKALHAKGHALGECLFYFGCRNRTEDFLYKDFLEQCQADGIVTKLFVAFSREQERKFYVQHHIAESQDDVWRLLNNKTHFYICGDAKHMARDVEQAVIQIIQTRGEGLQTAQAAEEFLNKMQQESRYLKDVWTTR